MILFDITKDIILDIVNDIVQPNKKERVFNYV